MEIDQSEDPPCGPSRQEVDVDGHREEAPGIPLAAVEALEQHMLHR